MPPGFPSPGSCLWGGAGKKSLLGLDGSGQGAPGSGMEQRGSRAGDVHRIWKGKFSAEELTKHLTCLRIEPRGGIVRKSEHKNRGWCLVPSTDRA